MFNGNCEEEEEEENFSVLVGAEKLATGVVRAFSQLHFIGFGVSVGA